MGRPRTVEMILGKIRAQRRNTIRQNQKFNIAQQDIRNIQRKRKRQIDTSRKFSNLDLTRNIALTQSEKRDIPQQIPVDLKKSPQFVAPPPRGKIRPKPQKEGRITNFFDTDLEKLRKFFEVRRSKVPTVPAAEPNVIRTPQGVNREIPSTRRLISPEEFERGRLDDLTGRFARSDDPPRIDVASPNFSQQLEIIRARIRGLFQF